MTDMKQLLKPGRYVVAVSGGVDSIALLHVLAAQPGLRLTVAHYDHGIRGDSILDRHLVQQTAKSLGLPFVYDEGKLGPAVSEDTARQARYDFLHTVRQKVAADAIVTAHHQDDVVETAILNLLRGTGRKGLSSLRSSAHVQRPLLHVPKHRLKSYAQANGLVWREDSTNTDTRYKRNAVRQQLTARLTPLQRQHLQAHIERTAQLNHEIDSLIANHLHVQPAADRFERSYFIRLPHAVALEVLAAWLRRSGIRGFDRKGLMRMVIAAKTYLPEQQIPVRDGAYIAVGHKTLALRALER